MARSRFRPLVLAWKGFCYALGGAVVVVIAIQLWFLSHIIYWSHFNPATTAFMDRYLEIQQVRFPDRLHIERAIDPESLQALVPSLILQPLVENAVMHGVAARRGPGAIQVTATRRDGRLDVHVRDTGPGFAANPPVEGIGLRNTRARLEQLYGPEQRFECGNDDQGAWVRLEVPYRTAHKALVEESAWTA